MSFYGNAQNTASNALTKFGQTCTHTIRTAGTYNPSTGGVTVTETTQSVKAALFDYRLQGSGTLTIDGMLVLAGDKKALIASKNITAPKVDDTLTVSSVVWTIKNVKELNPAGTSIMFELHVRKMSFALDLSKFADKVEKKTELVIRKIVLDCARSVVIMSPVDTGRFKGNWDYGVTTIPTMEYETKDLIGGTSIRRIQSKSSGVKMAGFAHYIANNLDYAQKLEDGYSRQAPYGMVKLTVMRFQPIVDAAARAIR